jgi:hypothetical protein
MNFIVSQYRIGKIIENKKILKKIKKILENILRACSVVLHNL